MGQKTLWRGLACVCALIWFAAAPHVQAQSSSETARFDIYIIGVKAGNLTLSAAQDSRSYALSGRLRASGVAELFSDFRMDAETLGRLTPEGPAPLRYKARTTGASDEALTSLDFTSTPAKLTTTERAKRHWLEPAEAEGAVDPLTMLWEVLRKRTVTELCRLSLESYDGARLTRVTARDGGMIGSQQTCLGRYERVGGFSRRELRRGEAVDFTLFYDRGNGGWELARMDLKSPRGRAQLIRR